MLVTNRSSFTPHPESSMSSEHEIVTQKSMHLFNALWMGSEPALVMESQSPIYIALLLIMSMQIILGNLLLLHTVFSGRLFGNKATTSHVILSLASADLLIGTLVIPYYAIAIQLLNLRDSHAWHYRLWSILDSTLTTASIYSLALVTLDRLLAIRYPLHYTRTLAKHRLKLAVFACWALALSSSFAGQLLASRASYLQLTGTIITFYLPFVLILYCNCCTFLSIRAKLKSNRVSPPIVRPALISQLLAAWPRSAQSTITSQSSASTYLQASRRCSLCTCAASRSSRRPCTCAAFSTNNLHTAVSSRNSAPALEYTKASTKPAWLIAFAKSRSCNTWHMDTRRPAPSVAPTEQLTRNYNYVFKEFKLIKLLGTINLCFVVCWLPYYVHSELVRFELTPFNQQVTVYLLTLGWFNSGVDPIIYLYLSNKFRKQLRKTLCCLN